MKSIHEKNNDAVSPVIGILLMLVVTIIIAAVVSAFAGGLAGDQDKTPQASFSSIVDDNDGYVIFEHNGGEQLALSAISVTLTSEDTGIQLSSSDIGTNCVSFASMGSDSSKINPGDKLAIKGNPTPGYGIAYGSFFLEKGKTNTWSIIDKKTTSTISKGKFTY